MKDILNHSKNDPVQAFPSPESTIYNLSHLPTTKAMSWGPHSEVNPSLSARGSWPTPPVVVSNPNQMNSPQQSLIASNYYTHSPPTISAQLPPPPPSSSLAKYHTCSDNGSHNNGRLPTPPSSITELHQNATGTHSWGTRLPPLKAIMNGLNCKQPPSSAMFPLLLPPPSQMVGEHHSSSGRSRLF